MTDERLLLEADKLYRWDGPKRKTTLLSGTIGRLVLTDRRLMFLSTGKHDVTAGRVLMAGRMPGLGGLSSADTSHLDLTALTNPGGLEVPVEGLRSHELKGAFKYLVVSYVDAAGRPGASSFAPKSGAFGQAAWIQALDQVTAGSPTPPITPSSPPARADAAPRVEATPPPTPARHVEASAFPPIWAPDPTGRHEHRYWDGQTWSAHVSDGGVQGTDPL